MFEITANYRENCHDGLKAHLKLPVHKAVERLQIRVQYICSKKTNKQLKNNVNITLVLDLLLLLLFIISILLL